MRAAPASLAVDIADDEGTTAPAQCAAATVGHCELPATDSGATAAGACEAGHDGACSYSCTDGVWTQASNTCAAERCGPAECADGTCDARADDDTGSCGAGSYADAEDTAEEWRWSCGGTACAAAKPAAPACGSAEGSCDAGTASAAADTLDPATERWSCSNGGETAACSAAGAACGTNETHALDGRGELACECETGHESCGGSCVAQCGANEVRNADTCACDCDAGQHRHGGACAADPACNAGATDPADACTAGTYGATPADTYEDGACGRAADSCDAGTADASPADVAAADGACGAAVDGCAAGTLEDVDDTAEEHRWNCLGETGAANWSCAGTSGNWNWSCTSGAVTLGSCTAAKTGATETGCTAEVAADDAACSLCKAGHESCGGWCVARCGGNEVRDADTCACECAEGYHRHDGACAADPACGGTGDACAEGSAGTAADTLDPPTARWSCASGGETESCTAPFSCGTNETAELDGSDELRCVCAEGHHPHNGSCAADPACNASATDAADACATGTYGEAPADTYKDGACGTAANSCDAGTADGSPADAAAVDGACGTAVDACGSGTLEDVDDTDAEHRWNCLGDDGTANWDCTGTAGNWNWSCTGGAVTLDSCTAPKTGTTAMGCSAVVLARDDECRICRAGYTLVDGLCRQDCHAATEDRCVLGSTTSGGTSGTCEQAGTCDYSCEDGVWTRTDYICREYASCVGGTVGWTVNGRRCEAPLAEIAHGESRTASDGSGAVTGSAAYSCDDGDRTLEAGATCGRECAAGVRTWTVGGLTCEARVAKRTHGGTAPATDATYPASGGASFACDDGTWSVRSGATCRAGCDAKSEGAVRSRCSVGDTPHGGSTGGCDEDGACGYRCENGIWTETSNTCHPYESCPAADTISWTVNGRRCEAQLAEIAHGGSGTATDGAGAVTGSAAYSCDDGDRTLEAGATCGRECAAGVRTWTVGGLTCEARVAKRTHGGTAPATDATYPASGGAAFACDDGTWSVRSGATCRAGCDAKSEGAVRSRCSVGDTPHGGSSGACDEDGACGYSCSGGTWTETSNTCHPYESCPAADRISWMVNGRRCEAPLAEIAHGGSGTATDGAGAVTGSAAYSCDDGDRTLEAGATCGRECAAGTRTWTVNGQTCSAHAPKAAHGGTASATDASYPETGSATFACADGIWSVQAGATCRAGCAGRRFGTEPGYVCTVGNAVHDGTGGVCDQAETCGYRCTDGSWTRTEKSCRPFRRCEAEDVSWTVNGQSCRGTTGEAAHGGSSGASDSTGTVTGSASFACHDGGWTVEAGATCGRECAAGTRTWTVDGQTCSAHAPKAPHGGNSAASDGSGAVTGSASFACHDGGWTVEAGATCGRECAGGTRTWTVNGETCSADVPKKRHGDEATATDATYPASGGATFACSDGVWTEQPGATCEAGCAAENFGAERSRCSVGDTVDGGDAGGCDEDGDCVYRCDDGDWTETSNSCHPWESCAAADSISWTVNGQTCEAALAEIAHGESGTASDGVAPVTGSADYSCADGTRTRVSATCGRECAGGARTWTVNGETCSADVPKKRHGDEATAADATYPASGSATLKCTRGAATARGACRPARRATRAVQARRRAGRWRATPATRNWATLSTVLRRE